MSNNASINVEKLLTHKQNSLDYKEYEKNIRLQVDKKIEQMEKEGKDTSGNLSNKITTKINIGATKESTITGAGKKLADEMNEALGKDAVSYTNTTKPFSTSSVSFDGDEVEGLLSTIVIFFLSIFGINKEKEKTNNINNFNQGEIKLDKNKEYQIIGINKDFHSTAVEIDNVNKLIVGYDPNGNFNEKKFYSLLSPEDRASLSGYRFIQANTENKNKGTITGMCGVLTTDWIEQELKTKLDERKQGITRYTNMQQVFDHYNIVNTKNNPDVNRMMAKNRVHFLMSKGENIETLKEYNDKKSNTLNIYDIKSTNNNTNIANKNYFNNQAHKNITSINI